jgi:hypothetical protein
MRRVRQIYSSEQSVHALMSNETESKSERQTHICLPLGTVRVRKRLQQTMQRVRQSTHGGPQRHPRKEEARRRRGSVEVTAVGAGDAEERGRQRSSGRQRSDEQSEGEGALLPLLVLVVFSLLQGWRGRAGGAGSGGRGSLSAWGRGSLSAWGRAVVAASISGRGRRGPHDELTTEDRLPQRRRLRRRSRVCGGAGEAGASSSPADPGDREPLSLLSLLVVADGPTAASLFGRAGSSCSSTASPSAAHPNPHPGNSFRPPPAPGTGKQSCPCNILEFACLQKCGISKKLDLNLSAHEIIKDVFLFPFPSS